MFQVLSFTNGSASNGAGTFAVTIPAFTFQAGDLLVVGARANKALLSPGYIREASGTWSAATPATTTGPGHGMILRAATAADSGRTLTISGWVAETTGVPSAAEGFVAVVRGVDTNVSGRLVSTTLTSGVVVPERVDSVRPVISLSMASYIIPAGIAVPGNGFPTGNIDRNYRITSGTSAVDRIAIMFSAQHSNADSVAKAPAVTYLVGNQPNLRNPSIASISLRGASPFKPAVQPQNWYVGGSTARVYHGDRQVW